MNYTTGKELCHIELHYWQGVLPLLTTLILLLKGTFFEQKKIQLEKRAHSLNLIGTRAFAKAQKS